MALTLTVSTPAFFESLKKSNLLSSKQVAHLRAVATQSGTEVEATAVAEALVKKGLITRWQATKLLSGKHAFFLGKYKLLDRIGSGGMGAVFKAEHTKIGHIVALKVVSKERLSQPGAIARFSREIQAAAALHHPNIIAAFDAEQERDTHFLVMEYVDGRDLNGWLKQYTTLPIDWSCECIRQAALGLQHAHEQGMVHRDIKPGNLLVTQDADTGRPITKILDMGLARFTSEAKKDGDITQTGQILGTPDYIAPEQARDTKTADIRADIFSLGCTLFRILTGKLPFEGDNPVEKLVARYTQDAPPLRSLRPEAPVELEAVLTKMMVRDPAKRYQLPNEVADALAPFSMSEGVSLADGDSPGSSTSMSRLETRLIDAEDEDKEGSSATCEFLNLLANVRAPEADTPHVAGDTTGNLPNVAAKGKAAATRVARYPNRPAGLVTLVEEKFADLPGSVKVIVAAACVAAVLMLGMIGRKIWENSGQTMLVLDWPAELRDEQSELNIDGVERTVPRSGALEFKGTWGPRRLTLTRKGYEPYVFEETLARGTTKTITPVWTPTPAMAQQMRIEADARLRAEQYKALAAEAAKIRQGPPTFAQASAMRDQLDAFIRRWPKTQESAQAQLLKGDFPVPLDRLARENLPADYQKLSETTPLAAVFGMATDDRLRHSGLIICVAHSEKYLASASQDELKIWHAATGQLHKNIGDKQFRTTGLAFNSTGKLLAALSYGGQGSVINVWDVETGVLKSTLTGSAMPLKVAFQPKSETTLIAGTVDGSVAVWDATVGGNPKRSFKAHGRGTSALAFSADGKRLYTAGQAMFAPPQPGQPIVAQPFEPVRIWDFEKGTQVSTIDEKIQSIQGVVVTPDEKSLAVVDPANRAVRVWDLASRQVRSISFGEVIPYVLDLSPDGKTLAVGCPNPRIIRLVDLATGTMLADIADARAFGQSFAFVAKDRVAFTGFSSFQLRMYDTVQKTEIVKDQGQGHQQPVISLSFSPGGETLASVGLDQRLLLWDTATGQSRPSNQAVVGAHAALFSPLGGTLAVSTTRSQLYLLDPKSGAIRKILPGMQYLPGQPAAWAFTPDDKFLVVAWSDQTLRVIDAATGLEVKALPKRSSPVSAVAVNFDGSRVAVAKFNLPEIDLVDTATWSVLPQTVLANQGTIVAMGYSQDGYRLVTSGQDGTLKFWDAKKGQLLNKDAPMMESVRTLSFHASNKAMATCNDTGLVKIWNYGNGVVTASYQLPQYFQVVGNETSPIRSVNQIAFSPDGRHVATANGNGTIYILRLGETPAYRAPGVVSAGK